MELGLKFGNSFTLRSAWTLARSTLPVSTSTRMALQISPELWENARRKLRKKAHVDKSFREYVGVRAAQLAQLKVDELVRSQSRIAGAVANKLILKASQTATKMILAKVIESDN